MPGELRFSNWRWRAVVTVVIMTFPVLAIAQQNRKKTPRSKPPELKSKEFEDIFFSDVTKQLQGPPPALAGTQTNRSSSNPAKTTGTPSESPSGSSGEGADQGGNLWASRISPGSIEDLVKGSKLRLDEIVTTPAKYAGGAFKDARREFTLLAILFGIIEQHGSQVRWKSSATVARMRFVHAATNASVGSIQAYNEAKARLQDLKDLVNGSSLTDSIPTEELVWSNSVDRVPLMQVLNWSLRDNLILHSANKNIFKENQEDVLKQAELIAAIAEVINQKGMPDADDPEYTKWSKLMLEQALATVQAVKLDSADSAREATAQMGQACDKCHETYQ